MSDGPYRSLPMSRGWKRLAECGENRNFEPADVCNAAMHALEQDWREGVPASVVDGIRDVFLNQQGDLFTTHAMEQLAVLKRETAGFGLARLLIDCAEVKLSSGMSGEEALAEVGKNALEVRASRGVRQVEEHYQREGTGVLARNVRARLEKGCASAPLGALARGLLNIGPSVPLPSLKHSDLDDGVAL